jgi:DnaK suppressor protein
MPKSASKAPAKPAAKKAAATKPAAKKPAAKKALKPTAKPAAKPTAKAATKPAAKPAAKAAPTPKKTTKPVAAKPATAKKSSPSPVEKVTSKAAAEAAKKPTAKSAPAPQPAAPPVAERRAPAPRPGKPALVTPAPDPVRKEYVPVSAAVPAPAADTKLPPVNPALRDAWKKKPAEQLSDDELMAMPEAEYMNDAQLAFFKLRLQQMQQDLLKHADETTEHLREDTLTVPDPADRATIEEEHALELRTRDRERKLMKKIQQALVLIDAGEYGYCEETGEPIGVRRLLARPTATLSLEAQQRRELKQKLYGD